ncbi:MAG: Asp-tRNA(Asn)/Glu-tRNA(Gln) amidotransferase subunit GatA [Tatlockia sp.]|jgi:aspartyl-tRNA(Asn)/glutamyl-tRNA(Gln) amidotransferase subunit A
MHNLTLVELVHALKMRKISSVELTRHCLDRIEQQAGLNAFIHLRDEEQALLAARSADTLLKQGNATPLTGIPMAHKDIFCTKDLPTTCGSKMLANYYSPFDATLVSKLQEQGVILLGKTNMDEFAMGSANKNSYFGPVKNPWSNTRVPGGSSGGSAAAVAAGLVPFATGSDTGGSIRQPAAFCGISGIKPTYGLVSRFGMIAYASSLDQAGPMAITAADCALVLEAMAGFDEKDSTSVKQTIPNYSAHLNDSVKGLRIGLPSCFFQNEADHAISRAITEAVAVFREAGAEIVPLDLPLQPLWVPCYYVIACAEASSNLSRFDGIRFGHQTPGQTLKEQIINTRTEGFGLEVKRRILTGTHLLSAGYFDAFYLKALKIRRLIQQEIQGILQQVDVIFGPTTPTCAFKREEQTVDPTKDYLADVFTVAANLAGIPALSIPAGFSKGLPIGMQLMGKPFSEARLLQCGHFFQQTTSWHKARAFPNR